MNVQHELSAQARNFNWLLTSFVEGTSGVTLALADVPYVPIAKSDRADNALRQARGHLVVKI